MTDVLVITGTGGMGRAVARRLGSGRHVLLGDLSPDSLADLAATLEGEGHTVTAFPLDVADADAVRRFAATAAAAGTVRSVVHTAGVSPVQASASTIVAVDVLGTAHMLDEFGEVIDAGGAMVCIASMAGTMTTLPPDVEQALATTPTAELAALAILDPSTMDPGSAYGIAKRANQVRVAAAAVAWGRRGGRVCSISPGIISTPMGQQELAGASGDAMRAMLAVSAVARIGTPDDIAAAVEFLLSPAASFISGTDLLVDGGTIAGLRYGMAP